MKLAKKRRIENKTNYAKRLKLLKSSCKRFVVRKTNRYMILQIIESKTAQDKILYSVNTKELLKLGYKSENSLKSITASYLGGLLLGTKIKDKKEKIVIDTGLHPSTKGSRIYSALKGLVDSGVNIPFNDKVFPEDEKVEGANLKNKEDFKKIKEKIIK